jgi:hypothetical protein
MPAVIAIIIFVLLHVPVHAVVDPFAVPNNRIGIHITDDHDLEAAAALVNSQGGQWGYVTLVIREDDRNQQKWQHTFDKLRELKIIPIVRLATTMSPVGWTAPHPGQAKDWALFLNSLNWVVENRYIVLFNEPNHAKEWGGVLAPHDYVAVSQAFIQELKNTSNDFFIMPAGFDLMAPNSAVTMEVSRYFKLMHSFDNQIFTRFDGWSSHAYPNPHFSGSPDAYGKTSVRGYKWEVNHLKQYGLSPDIPIFITETGWNSDNIKPAKNLSVATKLEAYWLSVFSHAFNDHQIAAVTPFILRYLNPPFTGFSWLDPYTNEPLPHYVAIQNFPKIAGNPNQLNSARLLAHNLPQELIVDSKYVFSLEYQNTGQTIWDNTKTQLKVTYPDGFHSELIDPVSLVKPFDTVNVSYAFTTPQISGTYPITFTLIHNDQPFGEAITREIKLIPPPSFLVKIQLWYKRVSSGNDFALLIYDEGDLVKEIKPVTVTSGQAMVESIKGLIPGTTYRFVLTKPYYLPRQTYETINRGQTAVVFERLLPYDFYPDGQFTLRDIWNAIRHPLNTFRLLSI